LAQCYSLNPSTEDFSDVSGITTSQADYSSLHLAKLRTAERVANLLAVFCILSWRILWLTMLNRTDPDASPKMALTGTEIALLDQLVDRRTEVTPPS
jgi:hypothetical protein